MKLRAIQVAVLLCIAFISNAQQDEFTPENLKQYLQDKQVKYPHIAYAQAVHETGNFTAPIFKVNHNLFGMKQAKLRKTTASGTRYGHAYYRHNPKKGVIGWKLSVDDYLLWQQMFSEKWTSTEKQYFILLGLVYNTEDVDYVKKVKVTLKILNE